MTTPTQALPAAASRATDTLRAAGRWLGNIFLALSHIPNARRAAAEYEALMRLDDSRLAERGLKRDEIARHVFLRQFPNI